MKTQSILRRILVLLSATVLTFTSCAANDAGDSPSPSAPPKQGTYQIPEFQDASFHVDLAEDCGALQLDASGLSQGYVAVRAERDSRMKFQIICGETKYNYDLPSGQETVFPLNMGSGSYTFRLMEQVSGSKYACIWSGSRQVTMDNEFQPFLRPSQMVNYNQNSDCVAKSRELASRCDTDAEVASAVYDYLVEHIRYDKQKAATVQSGYLPSPDETLRTGKGICFDYAALAAGMLRSVGIPCKLITGYVEQETYHAWNSFFLKEQGWITVEIQAQVNSWQRVDITFAAGGTPADRLTNDSLYTTRYVY